MLENLNTRVSIILLVIAASWYFLIPTINLYYNDNLSFEEIQSLEKDAINLGLDLKGGLRIVLELDDAVYLKNKVSSGLRKSSKIEAENFINSLYTEEGDLEYSKIYNSKIIQVLGNLPTVKFI